MNNNKLSSTFLIEVRQSLGLSLPLMAAALAQMGMDIVDTLMMGRLGPHALAAGSLASAIFILLFIICVGIISGVGVLVARAYGAGTPKDATFIIRQGFWLTLFISIPGMIIIWCAPWFLLKIGEDPAIVANAAAFLHALVWGLFPGITFLALREFVAGLSRPRIIMLISVLMIPINALGNYLLMYGKLGLPALGIAGIGYATSIVEWLALTVLIIYIIYHPHFRSYNVFRCFDWCRQCGKQSIG